ncbi:MAG: hypothetical protein HY017_26365 [Betaproteobacteria bacterium]|nr:hypothetical protein [Betaproteobacteria bacterium]
MRLPRDLLIAQEKLTEYLLRWRPEDDKSAYLAQVGYTAENAVRLMEDIREQLMPLEAELIENTEYGPKFAVAGVLTGPNGRDLQVVTIWMAEDATGRTKFITLYPDKT